MGLLHRKPGRGTEVRAAAPNPEALQADPPPQQLLRDRSGAPVVFDVYRARGLTRGADAGELSLFGSYRLATLERTLRHAGKRTALDDIALPEALLPALSEDADPDLGELLRDAGLAFARIEDRLSAAITSMSESVALSCDRHTALLVLTRIARDADGTPIARQRLRLIADGVTYGT
jgi:GntR family transcriptional regulator